MAPLESHGSIASCLVVQPHVKARSWKAWEAGTHLADLLLASAVLKAWAAAHMQHVGARQHIADGVSGHGQLRREQAPDHGSLQSTEGILIVSRM